MNKKKVDSILKGVTAAGIAIGGNRKQMEYPDRRGQYE